MDNKEELFNLNIEKIPDHFFWKRKFYLIGLTGTIAAGKSTAANYFQILNCKVYNADRIAKNMYFLPEIKKKVIDKFGTNSYVGENQINSKYLADVIFKNKENLKWINSLIHPLVKDFLKKEFKKSGEGEIIIYDVPLLFESNAKKEMDYDLIIVIDAPLELRMNRAIQRNNWTKEEFIKREEQQMRPEEKRQKADCVIWNDSDPETLNKKIKYIYNRIQNYKNKKRGEI